MATNYLTYKNIFEDHLKAGTPIYDTIVATIANVFLRLLESRSEKERRKTRMKDVKGL